MRRFTAVRSDRFAPKACPLLDYFETEKAAKAYALTEVKWESTDRVWILNPEGSVIAEYEGDFTWLDEIEEN